MQPIFHTGAIIYNPDNRTILIQHRTKDSKMHANMWCLFGGKAEPGEIPDQTIIRELKEEIGIEFASEDAKKFDEYLSLTFKNNTRHVYLVKAILSENDITLGEGQGFEWVPYSEVLNKNLTSNTRKDLEKFLKIV